MSVQALLRPRLRAAGRPRLRSTLVAAALATAVAPSAASAETGQLTVYPTGLGKVYAIWNLLGNGGTTSELLEGDRVVDRQVDPYPPGTGAGIGGGSAMITIPDSELYGSTPITFSLRILDDAGKVLAVSPTQTVGPCPARPPRAKAPTDVTVDATGAHFARISWRDGEQDLCHAVPTGYVVTAGAVTKTVPATHSTEIDGLAAGTYYDVSVAALPASTVQPEEPGTASFTTNAGTDTTPPSQPGAPSVAARVESSGHTVFTATWGASTDDVGVVAYELYSGSTFVTAVGGGATSTDFQWFGNRTTPLSVVARDAAGNRSTPAGITFDSCPRFGPPALPIAPTDPGVTEVTSSSATITWKPGHSDACGLRPAFSFDVYRVDSGGGAPTVLGSAPSGTDDHLALTGLTPDTDYTVFVAADGMQLQSTKTPTITFHTALATPVTQPLSFAVKGSTTVKKLVNGSLPLSGTLQGALTTATGAVSADLALRQSTANLIAFGILPVTATVKLAPTTPVTGTFTGTSFKGSVGARVKLPSIRAFGITIGGGASCQTTAVSTISLAGPITAVAGGTLTGSYPISSLAGCGALNGVISPIVAGSGNAIVLKLTPTAAAAN